MADERRLIARAQSGDTAAFRALVERHQARAHALALRILRSPSDAEEVAQDAFVRVWTALPGFRGESTFATWLHRIVARRAFDRVQVLRNRHARERPDEGLPEPAAPAADEDTLRSVEDVAHVLGMPENTVKTHLLRARAALRAAWTHALGDES